MGSLEILSRSQRAYILLQNGTTIDDILKKTHRC